MRYRPSASFGLLQYNGTGNLGDEIQSIAARRFLPAVDHYIDRERLSEFHADAGPVWTILSGWFLHRPENWPPSPHVIPLLVSFHISPHPSNLSGMRPPEAMLSAPAIKYLHGFAPVGARDLATLDLLRAAGVDSYFSGCLTLTLERPPVASEENLVVLSDVPETVPGYVAGRTSKRVEQVTHIDFAMTDRGARFARAEELLAFYARASCVITTRLHCALPCIAMGTPVLLLDVAHDQERFSGLNDFVRHASPEEFLADGLEFDLDRPPPNPDRHLPFRAALIEKASAFVASARNHRRPPADPLTEADRRHVLATTLSRVSEASWQRLRSLEELNRRYDHLVRLHEETLRRIELLR